MDQQECLQLYHYKNSIYQGYVSNFKREGEGICLFDNRAVSFGTYKNDLLNNQTIIMLSPSMSFIGGFKRGMLDGPFVIRSPEYVIYSQTNMNRLEGEILVLNKKQSFARLWEVTNVEGQCIRQIYYDQFEVEQKILKKISPQTELMPTLIQFFMQKITTRFHTKVLKGKDKFQVCLEAKSSKKIIVQFERQRILSYGVYQNSNIFGLGYIYDKNSESQIEGEIQKNVINGEGLKKDLANGKIIFGKFQRGDIRTIDVSTDHHELADACLNKLKKKMHLHSLNYTNDFMNERPIYLLRNFYEAVIQNQKKYTQVQRSQPKLGHKKLILAPHREEQADELTNSIRQYNLINSALKNKK